MPTRHLGRLWALVVLVILFLSSCGSAQDDGSGASGGRVVELPGAAGNIDFDDIVYSPELDRIVVPARETGLYFVEPDSGTATRVKHSGTADSADEGGGSLFVADRAARRITVVDPVDGRELSSVSTKAPPDYVRYSPTTGDLWVAEPDGSPSGIEIFAVEGPAPTLHPVGFIPVPEGPEGLTVSPARQTVYTHAGSDLVVVDIPGRAVTARLATGCSQTHGFPRIDERLGVALAGCAADGEVSLLELDGGRQLGRYEIGGGEALPAYSERTGHFYVRADPGRAIATLQPSNDGLTLLRQVEVPEAGHCLTTDDRGHYWSCDAENGRVLRFEDSILTERSPSRLRQGTPMGPRVSGQMHALMAASG